MCTRKRRTNIRDLGGDKTMLVVDEQPVNSRNIRGYGGRGPAIDPHGLQRCVRTSTRASPKVATNPSILFTLCLLATIASVEAQAAIAPAILDQSQ